LPEPLNVGRKRFRSKLVKPDRLVEILQAVFAEIHAGDVCAGLFERCLREQDLAAVASTHNRRGGVNVDIHVRRRVANRSPGMKATRMRIRPGARLVIYTLHSGDGRSRGLERIEEGVAFVVDLVATEPTEGFPGEPPMLAESISIGGFPELMQKPR
jgi:hypothetical protein